MVIHMLTTGILREEEGILWLGETGEAEYGYRHFMELFTAFISEPLIGVRHGEDATYVTARLDPATLARAERQGALVMPNGSAPTAS